MTKEHCRATIAATVTPGVLQAKNTEVDELAKAAARKAVLPPNVFFQSY
jgi:hypothetical protein